jgi:hypothetical protein
MTAAALDLFGNPAMPPLLVRLDRQIDRDRPCCNNIATPQPSTRYRSLLNTSAWSTRSAPMRCSRLLRNNFNRGFAYEPAA